MIFSAEAQSTSSNSISDSSSQSAVEATTTLNELLRSSISFLPKLLIATAIFIAFFFLSKLVVVILRRVLKSWRKTKAVSVLVQISLILGGLAIALSVLAGDIRALLGSVGLIGLALSWALQTPIESFTGWLLNSFRDYTFSIRCRFSRIRLDVC